MESYTYTDWNSLINHLRNIRVIEPKDLSSIEITGVVFVLILVLYNWRRFVPGTLNRHLRKKVQKIGNKKHITSRVQYGKYIICYKNKFYETPSHFYVDNDGTLRDGYNRPMIRDDKNKTGWFVDYPRMIEERKNGYDYPIAKITMARIVMFLRSF